MARASSVPPPPPVPFWQLSAFRWGVLALGGLLLLIGVLGLEKLNRSYQLERRLEEDARLGPMARQLKWQIQEAGRSGILRDPVKAAQGQVPQALWLGRIAEVVENESRDTSLLVLAEAHLLAGSAGSHDRAGQVRIGCRRHGFGEGRPRPGETWLISVWRDGAGNAIHSAARYGVAR